MMYKPGDIVRVRDDIKRGERYYMNGKDGLRDYSNTVTPEMVKLAGTMQEIYKISSGQYILKDFLPIFRWTDGMFQDPCDADIDDTVEFSDDAFLDLIFR